MIINLFTPQTASRLRKVRRSLSKHLIALLLVLATGTPLVAMGSPAYYDLDQAIAVALENNRLRTISQQSLAIAEAQYHQAASSYWPTLSLNLGFHRRDEETVFENPELQLGTFPVIGPVAIPAQEIKMLGQDTSRYSLELTYPLYTGGKRASLVEQAKIGINIATKEVRRTDLQLVQDVKRYFYAALYTRQLVELAEDITLSFEVLRDVTQVFFEKGSHSVNKLDLLRSKLAHTMAQSTLAELKSKHQAALSALSFAMGLDWREEIRLGSADYPETLTANSLDGLIDQALNFNPEIEKLALAVEAYEAKIDEATSGYYPTLALLGSYEGFNSDLGTGFDIEQNQRSWSIGLGLKMNLFEGGRTRHQVSAAKTKKAKMEQQHLLVSDAVATQVKSLFLQLQAAQDQLEITRQSLATSKENRDLTGRAYQTGAVETQKVISANLFDAMIHASHYRAEHDRALHLAEISYLLGKEALK